MAVSGCLSVPPGVIDSCTLFFPDIFIFPANLNNHSGNLNEEPFLNPELENFHNEEASHIIENETI